MLNHLPPESTPSRNSSNHYLVFVHNFRLSPLLLNDSVNSFEIYSINSRNEFVDCFQSQRPGCLVTSIHDDFLDYPNVNLMSRLMPLVMVTGSSSLTAAATAAKKGAHSVLKNLNYPDKLRDAVRNACFADARRDVGPFAMRCRIDKLTGKEKQVMYMSLRGKTTKMISNELGVCHQTVDKHKKRALSKLQASSVVELINLLMDAHRIAAGIDSTLKSVQRVPQGRVPSRPNHSLAAQGE